MKRVRTKPPPPTAQQQLELRDPGQPTAGRVANWFLDHHVNLANNMSLVTQRGYRSTLRMFVAHFGEDVVPTLGAARDWLARRLNAGELTPLSANSHRDRMHAVYELFAQQGQRTALNPFTFRRFPEEDRRHLRGEFDDFAGMWPKLLAGLPDDRARAMVSLAHWRGWRLQELLGLEWRHVAWKAPGGPEVTVCQQRRAWEDVPTVLKHNGLIGTYPLPKETEAFLRSAQRHLRSRKPLLGCAVGSLVGTRPCADKEVRQFVFPYREEHVAAITEALRKVAPHEFPPGQAFHRLRRAFGHRAVRTAGPGAVEKVKKWLRHKSLAHALLYAQQVLGVQASREEMRELDAAGEDMLSETLAGSDNVEGVAGQQNHAVERSGI